MKNASRLKRDESTNKFKRIKMKIQELMTKSPACCEPSANLHDVAHLMAEKDCGAIPVVENFTTKKPVGIITDRDITVNTLAKGKNPLEMTAAEIMTFPVISLPQDATLGECCKTMEANKVRRMVVIDEAGGCCGIVAQADVARTAAVYETAALVKEVSMEHEYQPRVNSIN
jgi:CBS domain-containing protein